MSSLKINHWTTFENNSIYCINLIERPDRLKAAKEQFEKVGLLSKVTFFRTNKSEYGGKFGCFQSHLSIMQKGLLNNEDFIIIFEDDVMFTDGWENVIADCSHFIKDQISNPNSNWDTLFIGCNILLPFYKYAKINTIWNVKCWQTHAYIVSKQGMEKFTLFAEQNGMTNTKYFQENRAFDDVNNYVWSSMFAHSNNRIVKQNPAFSSDIYVSSTKSTDRNAQWFKFNVLRKCYRILECVTKKSIDYPLRFRSTLCSVYWVTKPLPLLSEDNEETAYDIKNAYLILSRVIVILGIILMLCFQIIFHPPNNAKSLKCRWNLFVRCLCEINNKYWLVKVNNKGLF